VEVFKPGSGGFRGQRRSFGERREGGRGEFRKRGRRQGEKELWRQTLKI